MKRDIYPYNKSVFDFEFPYFSILWRFDFQAVFPVVWVDEGASIDEENLKELKKQLVKFCNQSSNVSYVITLLLSYHP